MISHSYVSLPEGNSKILGYCRSPNAPESLVPTEFPRDPGPESWHSRPRHGWFFFTHHQLNMAVCQNLVPLVNIKIAGKWMFIPLKMVLIGIDPDPHNNKTISTCSLSVWVLLYVCWISFLTIRIGTSYVIAIKIIKLQLLLTGISCYMLLVMKIMLNNHHQFPIEISILWGCRYLNSNLICSPTKLESWPNHIN